MHLCSDCGEVHENDTRHFVTLVETLLPLDSTCPYCGKSTDVGEVFETEMRRCANCGKRVFAAVLSNGRMIMAAGEVTPSSFETGRHRTRRLWRKRGRR